MKIMIVFADNFFMHNSLCAAKFRAMPEIIHQGGS